MNRMYDIPTNEVGSRSYTRSAATAQGLLLGRGV